MLWNRFFNKYSYFRFKEESGTPSHFHLYFKDSPRCSSGVGKKPDKKYPNRHLVKVGRCESFGSIVHELMHSIGEFNDVLDR